MRKVAPKFTLKKLLKISENANTLIRTFWFISPEFYISSLFLRFFIKHTLNYFQIDLNFNFYDLEQYYVIDSKITQSLTEK